MTDSTILIGLTALIWVLTLQVAWEASYHYWAFSSPKTSVLQALRFAFRYNWILTTVLVLVISFTIYLSF